MEESTPQLFSSTSGITIPVRRRMDELFRRPDGPAVTTRLAILTITPLRVPLLSSPQLH
jgi:hypothetical protein